MRILLDKYLYYFFGCLLFCLLAEILLVVVSSFNKLASRDGTQMFRGS